MILNKQQKLFITHGKYVAKAYGAWVDMRRRCRKPRIELGERCYIGITICERWNSFDAFLEDMGTPKQGESLDRKNSIGIYELSNCRWATAIVQARNRGYVKLSLEKAAEIRRLYSQGTISQQRIADSYGVCQLLISKVIRNLLWI